MKFNCTKTVQSYIEESERKIRILKMVNSFLELREFHKDSRSIFLKVYDDLIKVSEYQDKKLQRSVIYPLGEFQAAVEYVVEEFILNYDYYENSSNVFEDVYSDILAEIDSEPFWTSCGEFETEDPKVLELVNEN